jgi:S-DNA-T family DNA segregation ATPase FtsK/SpoIIIE
MSAKSAGILEFLFDAIGKLLVALIKLLVKLLAFTVVQAFRHPRTVGGMAAVTAAMSFLGWQACVTGLAALMVSGSVWKQLHPASWNRTAGTWLRNWYRRWWSYRRVWVDTMVRCGLSVETPKGETEVGRLVKVSTTPYWDRLRVRLAVGQELGDFRAAGERLRTAFQAERVAVCEIRPALVGVDVMHRDPFRHVPVPATALPANTAEVDFTAVPIGLTEFLEPLTVSVVGGHLAVAGTSGAGKASVAWNILRGLAPAIADGTVRPVFIDPKGQELRQGRALVATEDYASTDQDTLDLLTRLAGEMAEVNSEAGAAGERDFVPSASRPLRLIFIDELAPLLAYWRRTLRDKIEDALGLLLTQGRSAGYILVGVIQEPTKDVFRIRDLFQRRLALRVPTEAHTDAALTDNAVDRGAEAHLIPENLPGVLYALEAGASAAVRARLGHVTNADIRALVEHVTALRSVTELDVHRAGRAGGRKTAAA